MLLHKPLLKFNFTVVICQNGQGGSVLESAFPGAGSLSAGKHEPHKILRQAGFLQNRASLRSRFARRHSEHEGGSWIWPLPFLLPVFVLQCVQVRRGKAWRRTKWKFWGYWGCLSRENYFRFARLQPKKDQTVSQKKATSVFFIGCWAVEEGGSAFLSALSAFIRLLQ